MMTFLGVICVALLGFWLSKRKAKLVSSPNNTVTLPHYYGWCSVIWTLTAAVIVGFFFPHIAFVPIIAALVMLLITYRLIQPSFHALKHLERWWHLFLLCATLMTIAVTVFVVVAILVESWHFFHLVPITDFLFGLDWSPQSSLPDLRGEEAYVFGAIPVFLGTLLITTVALVIAVPIGLMAAIYLSEYASKPMRSWAKPLVEMLAGIPTVVYGYFAALVIAPSLQKIGHFFGVEVASESALAAGLVMGVMIIPYILSLSDDALRAVPKHLREASLGLGATDAETIKRVVVPAALPGIIAAFLLAMSRAVGETMIVAMAAGLAANLTFNPLNSVTTVTVQILNLLVGDQEFDSAKTLSAFALGLVLFVMTLMLNGLTLWVTRRARKHEG